MSCKNCGVAILGKLGDHHCDPADIEAFQKAQESGDAMPEAAPQLPPNVTVLEEPEFERKPIQPLKQVNLERVYTYWLWYMAPFQKPKVSPECEAWVLSGMQTQVSERQKQSWFRALAKAQTVKVDAAQCLTRKPGSLSTDREQYRRKGFVLCQRAEGEVGSGEFPFRAWPVELNRVHEGIYNCEQIEAELKRRLPWGIAQITARISDTERRMEQRGITASQLEYAEETLGLYTERLVALKSGSVPMALELYAFFLQFDALVAQASQDVKMKEQMDLASKITGLNADAAAALAAARDQLAAAGSPA